MTESKPAITVFACTITLSPRTQLSYMLTLGWIVQCFPITTWFPSTTFGCKVVRSPTIAVDEIWDFEELNGQ